MSERAKSDAIKAEAIKIIRNIKHVAAHGSRYSNERFDCEQAMISLLTCPWRW